MLKSTALDEALYKKAVGYKSKEVSVEYVIDEDGNKRPIKEKCQTKFVPPDISALKTYLELKDDQISELDSMTDEELEAERQRLIKSLSDKT